MNFSKKGGCFASKMYGIWRVIFLRVGKEANRIDEKIPVMKYSQYRRVRKLVRACCNYDGGDCLLLDDGEACVCVQSISYSLRPHGAPAKL